jgi:hypothetical protein
MSDGAACSNYSKSTCDLAPSAAVQASYIDSCQGELQVGQAQHIAACN